MTLITTPLRENDIQMLNAGDRVLISGYVYGARDAAHRRFIELLDAGDPLPVSLEGETLYYTGPSPAPPGRAVGACGPTTSSRMDPYTGRLLALGLKGMLGKGTRSPETVREIEKYGAIYFAAAGGLGALLSRHVKEASIAGFPEFGAEALFRIKLEKFPAIVAVDSRGVDFYRKTTTKEL